MTPAVVLNRRQGQTGQSLPIILTVILAVTISGAAIWFVSLQQGRAGARYRSAAALHLAEAGVYRTLAIFESRAPDGTPGRLWRPAAERGTITGSGEGSFQVSVAPEKDGALLVTSDGRSGGAVRRVRARVYLASPTLLAALSAASTIRFEGARGLTMILPYGALENRPWVHLAAGREIWFATADVRLNDPAVTFATPAGPLDLTVSSEPPGSSKTPEPARMLLAKEAKVTVGRNRRIVDAEQPTLAGVHLAGPARRTDAFVLPQPDSAFYQALASANEANKEINKQTGKFVRDAHLERKKDSLYGARQFAAVIGYLGTQTPPPPLRGTVYVAGRVTLPAGARVTIIDGALISESTLKMGDGTHLSITHSPRTRALSAVIVLKDGGIVLGRRSLLYGHGLIYSSRTFEVAERATVLLVGALTSNDPRNGVRIHGATLIIRYDPAVLGTPGLRVAPEAPAIAWVAEWMEPPP